MLFKTNECLIGNLGKNSNYKTITDLLMGKGYTNEKLF